MSTKILTFKYLAIPKRNLKTQEIIDEVHIPVVPIRISYAHRLGRAFHALVDSGAERNLFPAELGEVLGMKIKKGMSVDILGIGGVEIKGFRHKIRLYLGTLSLDTEADLSYEQQVPLLGRTGFFNIFNKVVFRESAKTLELEIA